MKRALSCFVVARHREFQHVDGIAFDHVLENRAVVDEARRQRFEVRMRAW